MDKQIYFLSGLPRTGSTLLGSILAQNPQIHVTPTSPLFPLLSNMNDTFSALSLQYTFDHIATADRIYQETINAFYADIAKPVIFDKHRMWPSKVQSIKNYINQDARIICPVRPIAEIIVSYLKLADKDPNNFIDKHLKILGAEVTDEARANLLWQEYLNAPYEAMMAGLKNNPSNILLINYRDIVFNTSKVLSKIYKFCDLDAYEHKLDTIENNCAEDKDEAWGMKDLHTIRPSLSMQSDDPATYLPQAAIDYFAQFDVRGAL